MVGENKILTVSYGTFSCTLEGFDEPFSAMRQIAEYFRDLAAEDRFFGAEPPTPDPDRLHMIAQQTTSAAIATQTQDDGTVALRQENQATEEPREVQDETPEPDQIDEGPQAEAWADSGPSDFEDTSPAPENRPIESAVEKLARIRAAVENDLAENTPFEETSDVAPTQDDNQQSVVTSLHAAFRDVEEPAPDQPEQSAPVEAIQPVQPEPAKKKKPEPMGLDDMPPLASAPAALPVEEPLETAVEDDNTQDEEDDMPQEQAQSTSNDTAAQANTREGAALLQDTPIDADTGDGAADRIFSETDNQLEGSEARRRHSAIAHLKAAVSATVADRNILGWRTRQNAEEEVAYRDDLAKVVRPSETEQRIPQADETDAPEVVETPDEQFWDELEAELDGETDDEPLVLGSTVRVEALALTPADRVADRPLAPSATKGESFEEYADRVGAAGLGELLEAAAAYTGQLQGSPQFSRPQIMKHVATAADVTFSREDGLRSFGILLRQGKIQKLRRGLFVLSDQSRFVGGNRLAGE